MLRVLSVEEEMVVKALNSHNNIVWQFRWWQPLMVEWCECDKCVSSLINDGVPFEDHRGVDLRVLLQDYEMM